MTHGSSNINEIYCTQRFHNLAELQNVWLQFGSCRHASFDSSNIMVITNVISALQPQINFLGYISARVPLEILQCLMNSRFDKTPMFVFRHVGFHQFMECFQNRCLSLMEHLLRRHTETTRLCSPPCPMFQLTTLLRKSCTAVQWTHREMLSEAWFLRRCQENRTAEWTVESLDLGIGSCREGASQSKMSEPHCCTNTFRKCMP